MKTGGQWKWQYSALNASWRAFTRGLFVSLNLYMRLKSKYYITTNTI